MSRSEKNYTVIKDILPDYNYRVIRILFLLHKYDSLFNYNAKKAWTEPVEKDKQFNEFFLMSRVYLRKGANLENSQKFQETEYEMVNFLEEKKRSIHTHLCNNFNTVDAILELSSLVNKMNIYFKRPITEVKTTLIKCYHEYIEKMLLVFGISYTSLDGDDKVNKEEAIVPIVDALVNFRDQIKLAAKGGDISEVLKLCDLLRDDILPHHGIRVEDQAKVNIFKNNCLFLT
jgi:cysteinyl-tRNA synthetase